MEWGSSADVPPVNDGLANWDMGGGSSIKITGCCEGLVGGIETLLGLHTVKLPVPSHKPGDAVLYRRVGLKARPGL